MNQFMESNTKSYTFAILNSPTGTAFMTFSMYTVETSSQREWEGGDSKSSQISNTCLSIFSDSINSQTWIVCIVFRISDHSSLILTFLRQLQVYKLL